MANTATTVFHSPAPARGVVAVTKSDATTYSPALRGLYVGGAGHVAVIAVDGTTAAFTDVPAGSILPVSVIQVLSTGTTATSITGMY
jgi:hypothetical protein